MKILVKLYDQTLLWAQHRYAPRYLAAVSFVEASVFPIPPYFMLAPMALAKPDRAWSFAAIATVASVLGGLLGYLLGYLVFYPLVLPLLKYFGYSELYYSVTERFQAESFWALLIAGFMPVPFKLIAIAAGFMKLQLPTFVLASILGRGVKFFAVVCLIKLGGKKIEQQIRHIIANLSWALLVIACIILGLKLFKVF